jgi:hypothetical protein
MSAVLTDVPDPATRGKHGPPGQGLRQEVAERISAALDSAPEPVSDVYVGWVAALDAAGCPARYRASGADGWGFPGWSPALAAGAVGRAALALHLECTDSSATGPLLPQPLEAVRTWLRDASHNQTSPVSEWVAGLVRAGDRASLAATAALATRWVAGFVRMVGWPLPERLALVTDTGDGPFARRWPKRWRPTGGSTVSVASSPDAVIGKVATSGGFDLLIHRPTSAADRVLSARAAFEATAGVLACGIIADHVVVTTGDGADRLRFPIDAALLERGTELIVEVVRQRVIAAAPGWGFEDAIASAACRYCSEQTHCPVGQDWLDHSTRHGGLPILPSLPET